jgi:hypothetical protein
MPRTRSYELPEYAISDEAAADIADMLMEIALQFDPLRPNPPSLPIHDART